MITVRLRRIASRNRIVPRSRLRHFLSIGLALAALGGPGASSIAGQSPAARPDLLRVHFVGPRFDRAAAEAEIPFIRAVDSLAEAQVEVVVENGPSGTILRFIGNAEFKGGDAVLACPEKEGQSPEEHGREVVRTIKLGLLRYVSKTPAGERVNVRLVDSVKPTSVIDPWNFWVFSASLDTFMTGEKSLGNMEVFANVSANRVTPEWKIRLSLNASHFKSTYDLEGFHYKSISDQKSFNGLAVKSLGEHWSIGASVYISSSTYSNTKWSVIPNVAVEYDVFPYSESTKHQLRLMYTIGPTFIGYDEMTIYDRIRETLVNESLSATLELNRPWGTISTTLNGGHYLHDLTKYRVSLNASISIRLLQGLKFSIDGGGARIHDQLSLPQGGATLEEVLLQRKQLETSYNYFFSVGLSYSFGSLSSHIINPRFGTGSGGTSIRISM